MKKKYIVTISIMLGALAVFFSVYKLTESPPVWYDEGFYIQTASNLAFQGGTGLRIAPDIRMPSSEFITVGYPLIYPLALWFKIFGFSVASARSLMVLFIFVLVAVYFAISKRLQGNLLGLSVLALLVTFPPLYGNGKSVLGEVPGLVYLGLFLLCFNQALSFGSGTSTKKRMWIMVAGVCAGLAIATKPLFILLLPVVALGAFVAWRRKQISLGEAGLGLLFLFLPLFVWFFVQFQNGSSLSGVLRYYANPSVVESVSRAIAENFLNLFTNMGTLYFVIMFLVWIAAIAVRLKRKQEIPAEEIMAFAFSALVSAAFLRTAGWFRYLFPAQIICLVFFPASLSVIVARRNRIVATVVVLLALFGTYQMFFDSWVAEAYGNHRTAHWQAYFSKTSAETSFFFYDTPEVAIFDRYQNYYQYIQPAGTIIGGTELDIIRKGAVDKIIAETATYEGLKSGLFALYEVEAMLDKYSILRRISKLK